jgi:uncharacterized protein DUF4339
MNTGYKLRLADGSEIGPIELEEVRTWYRRRLVTEASLVLKPGGSRWVPLREVIRIDDLRKRSSAVGPSDELMAAARAAASPRTAYAPPRGAAARVTVETQPWRTILVGAILLLAAAGSALWVFAPERWIPTLDETPWREIALGEAALGLLLIRGWELARRIVRLILVFVAAGLALIAGVLVAQHLPREALLTVASAFVFLLGLVLCLARSWLTPWRLALSVLIALAGAAGVARFGYVGQSAEAGRIREWALASRRFHDDAKGVTLDLPSPWVGLKTEQRIVPAGPGTWLVAAQPRLGGTAILAYETPALAPSNEEFLSRVLARRNLPAPTEVGRTDVALGAVGGRQAASRWEKDGARFLDVTVVARNGLTYWSLVGWVQDDGSSRPARELQALVAGLSLDGRMAAALAQAVRAATDEVPALTPAAAELVMGGAASGLLDPPAVFRRGLELANRGLGALAPAEARELDALDATACAALSRGERDRLSAYRARVRASRGGGADEDRAMAGLMKRAVLSLPSAEHLARLQGLYEKAIRAGARDEAERGPSPAETRTARAGR